MSVSRRLVLGLGITAAICLAGCDSGGGEDSVETGTQPDATTTTVSPPTDLSANVRRVTVRLSWTPPADGASVLGFGIYRDGVLLQGVGGDQTSFTDDDVKPAKTYTYEVRTRTGGAVSEPVSAELRVPVPPLAAARVVGDFAVTAKTVSQSGYSTYETPTFVWHFSPRCRTGACAVGWRDEGRDHIHARLAREGARYEGRYSGPFLAECNGTAMTSTVTLALKVARARALAGEWRATKLAGTLSNSEVAQLGCASSSAQLKVTAKLTSAS